MDEIFDFFTALGFTPDPVRLKNLVMQVDGNKNGVLEFGEFCEFLKRAKKIEGGLGIRDAVESNLRPFSNKDGVITSEDLIALLEAMAVRIAASVVISFCQEGREGGGSACGQG